MRTTLDWIRDYCPTSMTFEEVCERLTMATAPVEYTEELPGGDHLLEIEVTYNRPDLMSVIGIAREIHAITGEVMDLPSLDYPQSGRPVEEVAKVIVDDPGLCPRYIARVIEGVKIGPSPQWLVDRLESVGLRSVNNVVDVTNFVCLEYGQPLHAFDLDRLRGSEIIVRRALRDENMTTLDGHPHRLEPDQIVIADAERAVAVAGIMGGADSEVSASTTRLLLESASFEPKFVRRAARRLNLSTESSQRFEKGVPWDGVEDASRRATALILELAGGEALSGSIDVQAEGAGRLPKVTLRFGRLRELTGVDIDDVDAAAILDRLGFPTVDRKEGSVTVTIPGHRTDLHREADLIEEVLRIHGFDQVPENPQFPIFPVEENLTEKGRAAAQDILKGFGFQDVLTLSFGDPEDDQNPSAWTDRPVLHILDPVRPELGGLRRGLLSSLLAVKRTNFVRGNEAIQIAEVGRCYLQTEGQMLPTEKELIGILADGDVLEMKGVVESLVDALGCERTLEWSPMTYGLFGAGAAWECLLGDVRIGIIGRFSDEILEKHDLRSCQVVGAELDLEAILDRSRRVSTFRPLPRFPASRRDISMVLDESIPWGEVERVVWSTDDPLLQEVRLFDLYRGKQIPGGKKGMALSLAFRSREKTLTGEEIDASYRAVVKALEDNLGAEIRA